MLEPEQHPSCARIAKHIGDILLVHRTKQGFTQAYVAEQVGLKNASSINRFEAGKSTPSLDTLIRLTILLKINPNDFFHGLVLPAPDKPEMEEPALSLEELRELVEPFQDPKIRRVVEKSLDRLDEPETAAFVSTLLDRNSANSI